MARPYTACPVMAPTRKSSSIDPTHVCSADAPADASCKASVSSRSWCRSLRATPSIFANDAIIALCALRRLERGCLLPPWLKEDSPTSVRAGGAGDTCDDAPKTPRRRPLSLETPIQAEMDPLFPKSALLASAAASTALLLASSAALPAASAALLAASAALPKVDCRLGGRHASPPGASPLGVAVAVGASASATCSGVSSEGLRS